MRKKNKLLTRNQQGIKSLTNANKNKCPFKIFKEIKNEKIRRNKEGMSGRGGRCGKAMTTNCVWIGKKRGQSTGGGRQCLSPVLCAAVTTTQPSSSSSHLHDRERAAEKAMRSSSKILPNPVFIVLTPLSILFSPSVRVGVGHE
uniref:Uncharacterized protein n=1 Tax=Meloidogyne enterolobii TaxID=390850 RepID=A0A6V7W5L8_MELEN|nr:unnamed protein product [Meloidogyne enterolobii]